MRVCESYEYEVGVGLQILTQPSLSGSGSSDVQLTEIPSLVDARVAMLTDVMVYIYLAMFSKPTTIDKHYI